MHPGAPETDGPAAANSPVSHTACRRAAMPRTWPTRVAAADRWRILTWPCSTAEEIHTRNHQPGSSFQPPAPAEVFGVVGTFSLPVWMPGCRCGTCRRRRRTRIRGPRSGMTGPAAAWTGTRPISWPPTSLAPPGNPRGLGSLPPGGYDRQAEGQGRKCHGPQLQPEREPPFGTPRTMTVRLVAASSSGLFFVDVVPGAGGSEERVCLSKPPMTA
jgi:hypothetical protein